MSYRKVEELVQRVLAKLGELSYSAGTIELYRRNHFKKIIHYFKSKDQDYFDDELITSYIEKVNEQQKYNEYSKRYCNILYKRSSLRYQASQLSMSWVFSTR